MRDLYRKMGLDPTATADDIAAALEEHPELKAYSAILLDENRRSLYDRAHRVLKLIGMLRFRLDLDKNETWFIERHPDFAIMPKPAFTGAPQEMAGDETAGGKSGNGRRPSRWLIALVAAVVVAAAIIVILTL